MPPTDSEIEEYKKEISLGFPDLIEAQVNGTTDVHFEQEKTCMKRRHY